MHTPARLLFLLAVSFPLADARGADEAIPSPRPGVDLRGYRTVQTAIKADPKLIQAASVAAEPPVPGYVGVEVGAAADGSVIVLDVALDSPAEAAGLASGVRVVQFQGEPVTSAERLKDRLRGTAAGKPVTFGVSAAAARTPTTLTVTPRPLSKPFSAQTPVRVVLGVQSGDIEAGGGYKVTAVTAGGSADKAGVKVDDIVLKVDGVKLEGETTIRDALNPKKPGDVVVLSVRRGKEELDLRATLQADATAGRGGRNQGWDDRIPGAWKKPTYKLAILGIEYPDVKHNAKIADADWEASMFSVGGYRDKSATGQRVFGSMADYYKEISYGQFGVEGKFVGWAEVSKKRTEYSSGSGTSQGEKSVLLTEAMDKVLAKFGKDALKGYDGVFFIYAGGRVQTTRGGLYWPHRASVTHQGKRWPYFIVQEGGERMNDISVFCHEFGHMLGLPDLYARPEVPGMEGVGPWCAMSQQNGNGRPQHFSAWSKEQLGWIKPTTIDPRVKQKLILGPAEDSPTEYFKVIVRPDGSEYYLLENRRKKGFDADLPAEGLLVWRVLPNNPTQRVFLEEAHGVTGQTGPRVFLGAVPFPSPANTSFTPDTTPSSKSQVGGGFDVYLTNIRRLPDGRVTFGVGYEYQ